MDGLIPATGNRAGPNSRLVGDSESRFMVTGVGVFSPSGDLSDDRRVRTSASKTPGRGGPGEEWEAGPGLAVPVTGSVDSESRSGGEAMFPLGRLRPTPDVFERGASMTGTA